MANPNGQATGLCMHCCARPLCSDDLCRHCHWFDTGSRTIKVKEVKSADVFDLAQGFAVLEGKWGSMLMWLLAACAVSGNSLAGAEVEPPGALSHSHPLHPIGSCLHPNLCQQPNTPAAALQYTPQAPLAEPLENPFPLGGSLGMRCHAFPESCSDRGSWVHILICQCFRGKARGGRQVFSIM